MKHPLFMAHFMAHLVAHLGGEGSVMRHKRPTAAVYGAQLPLPKPFMAQAERNYGALTA